MFTNFFYGLYNLDVNDFFVKSNTITRGHAYKIRKDFCIHTFAQHFFTYRVIKLWNSLPECIAECKSFVNFKRLLRDFSLVNYCKGGAFN